MLRINSAKPSTVDIYKYEMAKQNFLSCQAERFFMEEGIQRYVEIIKNVTTPQDTNYATPSS